MPGKKNRQKKQKARAAWYPLVAKLCSRYTGQQFATSYVGNDTSISSRLSDHPIRLSDQPGNSTSGAFRMKVGASRTKTGLWCDSGTPERCYVLGGVGKPTSYGCLPLPFACSLPILFFGTSLAQLTYFTRPDIQNKSLVYPTY